MASPKLSRGDDCFSVGEAVSFTTRLNVTLAKARPPHVLNV
jgi:hypothetical protein